MSINSTNSPNRLQEEMRSLASSINELIENVRKLQSPIARTHEQVPQATEQLDKISEQTMAAAHQMLDTVERIADRESRRLTDLKKLASHPAIAKDAALATLLTEMQTGTEETVADSFAIMTALQFQDITTQQMNHAAALLEEIETQLREIMVLIDGGTSMKAVKSTERSKKQRAYDPHADLFERKTDQNEVDSLFQSRKNTPAR